MAQFLVKPWIVSSILEHEAKTNPAVQILKVHQKNRADLPRRARLSDKWNYIEALISPEAEEEANRLASQNLHEGDGALFELKSYKFEIDPSSRQYLLIINELRYIGSSGSLPFTPRDDIPILPANSDPQVVKRLLEQVRPEQNDTMNESEMDVSLLLDVGDSTQDVHTQAESNVNVNSVRKLLVYEELSHNETQESQRELFDDNTPRAMPSDSFLEDMYPEQASLGGTQQVDDDENGGEGEEETGAKDRERWLGDADNDIVHSSRNALLDLEEGEDRLTGELGVTCDLSPLPHEEDSQSKPGSAEDSLSFSLFHPPQQELVSEPSSIPEEGSLTFANSSVIQEDTTTKEQGREVPTLSVPASQDTTYSPQQAAKSSKFWPPTGFVKWLFKQVYTTFETQEEEEEMPQSQEFLTQIGMQTPITPLRVSSSKRITEDDLLDHILPTACEGNDADASVLDVSTQNPASSPVPSLSSLPASGIVAAQSQSFLGVPTPNSILKPPFESHGLSLSLSSPLIHSSHSEDLPSLSPRSSSSPRSSQSPSSSSSASSSCASFSSSLPSSSSPSSSGASVVSRLPRSSPSSQSPITVDPLLSPASLSPLESKKTSSGTKKRKREDSALHRSAKQKVKGKEKEKEKEKKKSVKKKQKRKRQSEEPRPRETANSGSNPFGVKSDFFKTFSSLSWVQKKLAK